MVKNHHPMRRWRFENGVTLARLAKDRRVSTTVSHLSGIESGKKSPSFELLKKLSAITGIPAGDFVNFKAAK